MSKETIHEENTEVALDLWHRLKKYYSRDIEQIDSLMSAIDQYVLYMHNTHYEWGNEDE